jgi:hypothetical protein
MLAACCLLCAAAIWVVAAAGVAGLLLGGVLHGSVTLIRFLITQQQCRNVLICYSWCGHSRRRAAQPWWK